MLALASGLRPLVNGLSVTPISHVFFATDIANFLACRHLLTLQRAEARGEIAKPVFRDPGADLLKELGSRHEQAFLHHLAEEIFG